MAVSMKIYSRTFKLHRSVRGVYQVKIIIILYNIKACDVPGYREITPVSELSKHPSNH